MDTINFKLIDAKCAVFQETTDPKTNASPGQPPYLKTTESGQAESLEEMKTIPTKPNGVYLGFAFEFNYHLLAERPIQKAYICDINPRMLALYEDIERLVVQHEDRNAFVKTLRSELSTYSEYYFGLSEPIEEVLTHLTTLEHSWLASDRKYETIRNLYLNDKIVHLSLNLGGSSVPFQELAQELRRNEWILDCVYLSNIPEWLHNSRNLDALENNLGLILSTDTVLIDAKKEFWESGMPKVRITHNPQTKLPDFRPSKKRRKTTVVSRGARAPIFMHRPTLSLNFSPAPLGIETTRVQKPSTSQQAQLPPTMSDKVQHLIAEIGDMRQ